MANKTRTGENFPPLADETRERVDTKTAAFHLGRVPRTLRGWASGELSGPITPARINGRLAWSVQAIRVLLQGGA